MEIKTPKISLGRYPTPLEKVENLSRILNLPNLYFKRDDLSGIGYGGNKIRKLEYLLADALARKADIIMTTGSVQSNFTREATACAKKLGLKPVLVLRGEEPEEYRGNLFLEKLMGAEIYFVPSKNGDEAEFMNSVAETLEKEGHTCYVIPVGGSTPLGCIGFVAGFLELQKQAEDSGITVDYIVVATGSGGTQAGLMVGKYLLNSPAQIIGIRVGFSEPFLKMVADKATQTAQLLGVEKTFSEKEVVAYSDFVGEGYDIPTLEANDALELVAQTEAIFLDPVYTGKAMAGLIGLVSSGVISEKDTVVFWHTGGDPALFAGEELLGKPFIEKFKKGRGNDRQG